MLLHKKISSLRGTGNRLELNFIEPSISAPLLYNTFQNQFFPQ